MDQMCFNKCTKEPGFLNRSHVWFFFLLFCSEKKLWIQNKHIITFSFHSNLCFGVLVQQWPVTARNGRLLVWCCSRNTISPHISEQLLHRILTVCNHCVIYCPLQAAVGYFHLQINWLPANNCCPFLGGVAMSCLQCQRSRAFFWKCAHANCG